MSDIREKPVTGNRVARDRLTNAVIWQYETDTGDWYDAGSEQNARDEAAYLGNGAVRTVPVKPESEVLLAEVAALRGRLAAVEALADRMTLPHQETGEPTGAHLLVAADMIRAALATGETK